MSIISSVELIWYVPEKVWEIHFPLNNSKSSLQRIHISLFSLLNYKHLSSSSVFLDKYTANIIMPIITIRPKIIVNSKQAFDTPVLSPQTFPQGKKGFLFI